MGNTVSDNANPGTPFGKIHPKDNEKARPGYYFNTTSKLYQGTPIEVLPDEHAFKKLKYGYAKSNKRVFYKGVPIQGAFPNTFSIISRPNVRNIIDDSEQLIKLNSVLGMDFNCNKKRLYYRGKAIFTEE